jgi:hypothetical protein
MGSRLVHVLPFWERQGYERWKMKRSLCIVYLRVQEMRELKHGQLQLLGVVM